MRCRLCLSSVNNLLSIFNENNESEIAKLIAKYFFIELTTKDDISSKICADCWHHLDTFHRFWLTIEEKQDVLRRERELIRVKIDAFPIEQELLAIEKNVCVTFPESTLTKSAFGELEDVKDITLCEPQIDAPAEEEILTETQEFDAAKDYSPEADDSIDSSHSEDLRNLRKRKCLQVKLKTSNKTLKKKPTKRAKQAASNSITKTKIKEKPIEKINKSLTSSVQEMDDFIAASTVLTCCLCKLPMINFTTLQKHFRSVHRCRGYVPCCNSRFTRRVIYVDHLKLHQNPEHFKCHLCNKILSSRNSHINHMATSHPPEEDLNFQCTFCPRKFARQYILDYHLKSHCNERSVHICAICEKGYRTAYDLKIHIQRVHQNKFVAVCDICGKNMRNKYNLLVHKADVHNEVEVPEVQCEICKTWLKNGRTLAKHMIKHRDEASGQKFVCSECGVEKTTRHGLSSHVRYHHTLKPMPCSVCGKEFKRARCLKEHMATHTGKDLYSCPFCTQTFKSHGNYHNHKKKMHPKEWVRKYSQPRKPGNLNINETTNIIRSQ